MRKQILSIMIVKTLLAVIIFAGVGTIIIGGGLLIGRQNVIFLPSNNPSNVNNKILISEKDAIRIANETEEANKFLETYPETKISRVFKPCLDNPCAHGSSKCEWIDAWYISYKAGFEKNNPELEIIIDINGKIREKLLGCRSLKDRGSIVYPGTTSATYLDLLNDKNYGIRIICNLKTQKEVQSFNDYWQKKKGL